MPKPNPLVPEPVRCGEKVLKFGDPPLLMGVLNVTPDSFSDGGRYLDPRQAVDHGERMVEEGAHIIDIGGESTRPAGPYAGGAECVPPEEEIRRVLPVIEHLASRVGVPLSIDTTKAEVARRAVDAGATIINDISALRFDPAMAGVVQKSSVALVLMHMKGTPGTMQKNPTYTDVIEESTAFLAERICFAELAGIPKDHLLVDPGLGFGKSYEHNFQIIAGLEKYFEALRIPVLIGPSRKKFVGAALNLAPEDRLEGTLAALALCVAAGAHVLRVHDVEAARRATVVAQQFVRHRIAVNASSPEPA